MKNELQHIRSSIHQGHPENTMETVSLFPGMELSYLSLRSELLSYSHRALDQVLEINYCRSGRLGWQMCNGNQVYLGQGDILLHTMKACAESVMTLPNGFYQGLTLCIDLEALSEHPPELLAGTGVTGEALYDKFCRDGAFTSMANSDRTERIFSAFYNQPGDLQLPYQRLKTIELLLYLSKVKKAEQGFLTEYRAEQVEIVREIHDCLLQHLDQRITIDMLSRRFLINPTTLKATFKSIYGTSIAAHIKAHRMEKAASLLRESNMSASEIAKAVGYDSQSKFTAAFKAYYHVLPSIFRK